MYMRARIELLQKEGLHPAGIFKVLKPEALSVMFLSVVRIGKKLQPLAPWPIYRAQEDCQSCLQKEKLL